MRSLFKSPFNSPMRSPTAEETYAFKMHLTPGALPYDEVTGVKASCSISGARWGIVNGVVTQFAANQPRIEDKGFGVCPAFTQLAKMTETLTDAVWAVARTTLEASGTFANGSNRYKLTEDTSVSTTHNFIQVTAFAGATDNNILGLRLMAERGSGRHIAIFGKLRDNTIVVVCTINSTNGTVSNLRSGCVASVINNGNNIWDIFATFNCGTGTNIPFLFWGLAKEDGSTTYTGDGVSYIYVGQPVLTNFGANGVPFIPPYVPNNTTSTISVVSEAATSTTGTSFDLDAAALSRFKDGLRGKTVGSNLWITPTFATPPWTDNGTHYVCDGTVTYSPVSAAACIQTGKFYEIEFTTGSVTTNGLIVYIGAQIVYNGTLSANTKYVLRNSSATTSANVAFSSGAGFVGQISKNIIIREVQAQGHIELEFESNVDSGWLATSVHSNILSARDNALSLFYISKEVDSSISFKTYDNTNLAALINQTLTVGKILRIFIDYGTYTDGTLKMRLTTNGVKSSVVAFSGSFGSQDLRFFYGNTVHAGYIRNLSYSEKPVW